MRCFAAPEILARPPPEPLHDRAPNSFFPNADGTLSLTPNAYTWTLNANVVFVEQPAGVGFSYSETTSDYTVGDYQASADVVAFMRGFLVKYPAYTNRPFFYSGESYGGHVGHCVLRKIYAPRDPNPASSTATPNKNSTSPPSRRRRSTPRSPASTSRASSSAMP